MSSSISKGFIILLDEPYPDRVATADIVAFGAITAQEKQAARVSLYPHDPRRADTPEFVLHFFELSVTEMIKGAAATKTLRVATFDHPQSPKISIGASGCFLLSRHFEGQFYVLGTGMFFDARDKDYDTQTHLLRRCAGLGKDPESGLTSKDKTDRYLTAYLLLYEFGVTERRKLTLDLVEVPIDPKISRLILQALIDADWSYASPGRTPYDIPHPIQAVYNLRLDAASKATWPTLDTSDARYERAVRAWLKENVGAARLQRMVPAKD